MELRIEKRDMLLMKNGEKKTNNRRNRTAKSRTYQRDCGGSQTKWPKNKKIHDDAQDSRRSVPKNKNTLTKLKRKVLEKHYTPREQIITRGKINVDTKKRIMYKKKHIIISRESKVENSKIRNG